MEGPKENVRGEEYSLKRWVDISEQKFLEDRDQNGLPKHVFVYDAAWNAMESMSNEGIVDLGKLAVELSKQTSLGPEEALHGFEISDPTTWDSTFMCIASGIISEELIRSNTELKVEQDRRMNEDAKRSREERRGIT